MGLTKDEMASEETVLETVTPEQVKAAEDKVKKLRKEGAPKETVSLLNYFSDQSDSS